MLAITLPLTACGSSGPTIPKSKLSKLVLTQADLPQGFTPFYVGKQLMADQTPRRRDASRYGREGGWIARFRRAGSARTPGPLVVTSRADLFKDAGGAKRDFTLYEGEMQTGAATPADVAKVGDATAAAKAFQGAGAFRVVTYAIAWRRGNATAEVEANGFAKRLTLDDAVALARKQDARLRAAAG